MATSVVSLNPFRSKAKLRGFAGSRLLCLFVLLAFSSQVNAEVSFYAFVQEKHKWKPHLEGWEGTARLIDAALRPAESRIMINAEPKSLLQMLTTAKKSSGEFRILYLATHMSSDGQLSFSNREEKSPDELIKSARQFGPIVVPDLMIVDCCYSASFQHQPAWIAEVKAPHLFVCGPGQVAWQIEVNSRQPLYVEKYYPAVHSLANDLMGEGWNGKLSYLGFQIVCAMANDGKRDLSSNPGEYLRRVVESPQVDERIRRTGRVSELLWFGN